ncbi:SHC-transforming protein 2 isoform X1 [Dermochelys coriacea]|uniref:SHC-transforming protein 2 isoform X1 n=2 Tax=Dermochelys coriacea TaxID=27794 RepID=UPI0018E832A7|nr:SHC-transforming protein 2 isoform X1 [Dermochelys coriacea]XP_043358621.1 SHC-transforming protein 2 isoform X1 [Dermochelys coriacea]XP_043358622.1 SHC-transforming protein 2 isoform X1 [Dermochelys coriacea]
MLTEPKYGRFRNGSVTPSEDPAMSSKVAAATPAPSPPASLANPCPALGEARLPEEQEAVTTFCMLIPKIPQWKFSSPSGFLSRSPSSASKDLSSPAKPGGPGEAAGSSSGLTAVLSACEPVCHSPCSLQVMNRFRGVGGRKAARVEGVKLAGEEWNRKGSFINKPAQGWLHPDERVLGPGVSYIVRYMGCIEVLRSMRSLDFNTRTQVTREAINRLYEAVPGVKGAWKKKAPNKALFSILGKNNLHFAGMSITVNISIDGLNLMIPTTRQIIANHHMQSISFASGGDTDMTDYVAYVAKDPINQRACHILECCDGLAQSIINTVGQAFELRFKQYLHSPPKVVVPPDRIMGTEESAWGDEEEMAEHDYYNSIPGKEPPLGGLVDSRLRHGMLLGHVHSQPSCAGHFSQAGFPARRDQNSHPGSHWDGNAPGQSCDGYLQADGQPLGCRDYEEHMYVNTQCLDGWEREESPPKDLFDMRPFEDALKLHESTVAGRASPPLEDQWPSPPTRKAPIAPTEEQLKREPWYHGKMSRRDAEKLLQMDGDFLVRDSITNPGQYVLTGMNGGQPKHLLLVDPEGVVRTKDIRFESISHLINYHLQKEQPIVAAESELHLRQVVKRKQ